MRYMHANAPYERNGCARVTDANEPKALANIEELIIRVMTVFFYGRKSLRESGYEEGGGDGGWGRRWEKDKQDATRWRAFWPKFIFEFTRRLSIISFLQTIIFGYIVLLDLELSLLIHDDGQHAYNFTHCYIARRAFFHHSHRHALSVTSGS
jgi:hypothetical protein